jgi:hypothetical protein
MPDLEGLLRAYLIDPDDWDRALIYADAIEEAGHDTRADAIRRGDWFASEVSCSAEWWLENGVRLCGLQPIRSVKIVGKQPRYVTHSWWAWSFGGGPYYESLPDELWVAGVFRSAQDAIEAMNRRALNWAREANGLPPLTITDTSAAR